MKRIFNKEKTETETIERVEVDRVDSSRTVDKSVIITETTEEVDTTITIETPEIFSEVDSDSLEMGREITKRVEGGMVKIKKDTVTGKILATFKPDKQVVPVKLKRTSRKTEKKDVTTGQVKVDKTTKTTEKKEKKKQTIKEKEREDSTGNIAWIIWGLVFLAVILLIIYLKYKRFL